MPILKEDPFHKYDPAAVDFGRMKGEVASGIQDDWKRDKVDDAKKRAITTSTNYDDFKSRVAGCTLKPITRNEFNAPPKFAFNRQVIDGQVASTAGIYGASASSQVRPQGAGAGAAARLATTATEQGGVEKLRNARELEREFRRCASVEEKVAILEQLDGDACARFFRKEVDAEFLRRMLLTFEEAEAAGLGQRGVARRLLAALAVRCAGPTQTAASFLIAADRAIAAGLLARDPATEAGEDVRICAALGMPPSSVAAAAAALAEARPSEGEAVVPAAQTPAAAGGAAAAPTGGDGGPLCDSLD